MKDDSFGNRNYVVQGIEGYTTDEALRIFKANYPKRKLIIRSAPVGMIKLFGMLNQKMNYGANIIEALNNYPEKFEAQDTWTDLGTPTITLAQFAKNC